MANKRKPDKIKNSGEKWQRQVRSTNLYNHDVKPRALTELNNPDVIYWMGGHPTYVHSNVKTFQAGIKTATTQMSKFLNKMVQNQQNVLKGAKVFINKEWTKNLNALGLTWQEFEAWWEKVLYKEPPQGQNKYFEFLALLRNIKHLQAAQRKIQDIKNETKNNPKKRAEELLKYGFITSLNDVSGVGSRTRYVNTAAIKQIEAALKVSISQLYSDTEILNFMAQIGDKTAKAILSGANTYPVSISSTVIGKLQEFLEPKLQDIGTEITAQVIDNLSNNDRIGAQQSVQTHGAKQGIVSVQIAAETSKGKLNTHLNKADMYDVVTLGDVSIEFLSSLKTGAMFDYTSQIANESGLPNIPIIRQFTATIAAKNGDFSTVNQHIQNQDYNIDGSHIRALINYVMRNSVAFKGVSGANSKSTTQPFKEMIVAYLAWLKIVAELIGDPNNTTSIPIAIRNMEKIYNTADIIALFINMSDPLDIFTIGHSLVNISAAKNFYSFKWSEVENAPSPASERMKLYGIKRDALINKNNKISTYKGLYNEISSTLKNLFWNTLQIPEISTWYQIKLDNLVRSL